MMVKKSKVAKNSALYFIREVIDEVNLVNPSTDEMIADIKMMNFTLRPLSGDIFSLAERQLGLLESLWKIGKIEEIVTRATDSLSADERIVFFNYIDSLEAQMQNKIAESINKLSPAEQKKFKLVKLEVFRKEKLKKDIN